MGRSAVALGLLVCVWLGGNISPSELNSVSLGYRFGDSGELDPNILKILTFVFYLISRNVNSAIVDFVEDAVA